MIHREMDHSFDGSYCSFNVKSEQCFRCGQINTKATYELLFLNFLKSIYNPPGSFRLVIRQVWCGVIATDPLTRAFLTARTFQLNEKSLNSIVGWVREEREGRGAAVGEQAYFKHY